MKISNVKTTLVEVPFAKPIKTAIHHMRSVGCALLQLETDEGLVGESYLFALNGLRLKALDEMLKGFDHHLLGQDPHYLAAIWQNIWSEINPMGHAGVTVSALSTIDTALWDLVGKAADKPLHHIFGACRDQVETYASGGLWLSQSIDELQQEAHDFIKQGFRAMKIRVGNQDITKDVARVHALREAAGDEIALMVDANQSFTPKQAIRLGRQLEQFNPVWFEEPVPAHDLAGHAQVRSQLDIPIASGETDYTKYGLKEYIEKKACDILMPDLQRIGGLSEMRKIAAIAEAANMPVSTHIFTEQSLSLAGSAPNCISVEHMPWFAPLFNEKMVIDNGFIQIPDRPGTGFTFDQKAITQYRL